MSDAKTLILDLADQFRRDDEAAADLWSWLPSHSFANQLYGDYACEHRPPLSEIMYEACTVLCIVKRTVAEPHLQALLKQLRDALPYAFDWAAKDREAPTLEEIHAALVELNYLPRSATDLQDREHDHG